MGCSRRRGYEPCSECTIVLLDRLFCVLLHALANEKNTSSVPRPPGQTKRTSRCLDDCMIAAVLALALTPRLPSLAHAPHHPRSGLVRSVAEQEQELDADDPVYRDELWLYQEDVRYGSSGGGVGYLTAYNPSMVDRSHTRAVLLLAPPRAGVKEFANRVALSCECLVLCPAGLAPGMPPSRMAAEAWAAATYLNCQHGAQSLVVLAEGALVPPVVELVAAGDIPAHALAVLAGDGREAALRDIGVPFLALFAAEGSGAAQACRMRDNLALNSRLGRDYCVRDFSECGRDFIFAPRGETEAAAAEDALALVEAWVGRYAE